jgi:energy-coupling factor transporter ATP-binding protein EcfA2
VARELGEVTCPFGWLEELTIRASPFVRKPIAIHFTKATVFSGQMGSGKTTAAQYLASALSPEMLGKFKVPGFLEGHHEYEVVYHCPDRHRLDVSVRDGRIVNRFDDRTRPI